MKRWWLRKTVGVGLLALLALRAAAQQAATVLQGRVAHAPGHTGWLLRHAVGYAFDTTVVQLDATGAFTTSIGPGGCREATLCVGRHEWPLWLEPGDTLTAQLDARHARRRPPTLAGRGAAQSYYRWRQQQERTASFYEAPGGQRDPRTPAEWRQRTDAFRQRAGEVLRRSHARYPLPPGRYQQLRQVLAYEWGHVLLSLPFIYEYEQPRPLRVVRPLPESYYDFGRELPLPQDSLLAYRAYRTYAAEYYPLYQQRRARQRLTFAENISRQFVLSYDSVATWAPGATQHLALATQLWFLLKLGAEADATSRLADFQRRNSRHPLHASLARLAAARQRTAPGQPLPPFRLLDEDGQPADLASLCGKVVYLDFWASWCKPCRAEQPALQALRRHFAGRAEVAFVGISIDARAADWHRALAQEPAAAGPLASQLQLIGQPGDAALRRVFADGGVPQYWLLGPDGHILNSHAPRPSHPGVAAAIEEAIRNSQAKATGD